MASIAAPSATAPEAATYIPPVILLIPLATLWIPTLLAFGDFSMAFLLPFAIATWALLQPSSRNSVASALMGRAGGGLWIELACVSLVLTLAIFSMMVSPEPQRAFRIILPMLFGICAILTMPRLTSRQARRLVYGLMISGAAVLAISLVASTTSFRNYVTDSYRFSAFFDNANQLSLILVIFLPVAFALFLTVSRPAVRLFCLMLAVVLATALVLSGGKTALAISFVTVALVAFYAASRTYRISAALVGVLFAAGVVALALPAILWVISWTTPVAYEKIMAVFQGGVAEYPSIRSRMLLWEASWHAGINHPFIGTGAGSRIFGVTHSHNLILDYFRGTGVGGALSTIVLLLAVMLRAASFFVKSFGTGPDDGVQTITAAMYLGALGYIFGNLLSDSFSPSTSAFFWAAYVAAFCSSEEVRRIRIQALASAWIDGLPGLHTRPSPRHRGMRIVSLPVQS